MASINTLASWPIIVSSRFSFCTFMPVGRIPMMGTRAEPMTARLRAMSAMVKAAVERWLDGVMERWVERVAYCGLRVPQPASGGAGLPSPDLDFSQRGQPQTRPTESWQDRII